MPPPIGPLLSELEIDADAEEVLSQAHVYRDRISAIIARAKSRRASRVDVPKVNIKILSLSSPIIGEGPFDAGASRPAGLRLSGLGTV